MTGAVLYSDKGPDYTGVVFQTGQKPILPETKTPLIDSLLTRLTGNTKVAKETLERRAKILTERFPNLIEKSTMLYGKRVNGMVDAKDLQVYLLHGRDIETGFGSAVLVVGRFDLDDPLIVIMPNEIGETFTEKEIIKANQLVNNDPFRLPIEIPSH